MKKPTKIVWAHIPETRCNLNCDYCYVGQKGNKKITLPYSVDYILKCLAPKRFGGPIFFGGVAPGETLLWEDIVDFTYGMLSYGHIVSYTTNMTVTPVIKKFCDFPRELRVNLELDASFHYLELKKKNLLNVYFENLRMLKRSGISYAIFLVISDIYIPYLREISELCKKEIGILPIAGMLRDYDYRGGRVIKHYSPEEEKLIEETCDMRQWHLQKKLYGKEMGFCHAGEYSLSLNMMNGNYNKCWIAEGMGNLFKNPNEPIKFEPIGFCPFNDCICASWQCFGLIPELNTIVPTHPNVYFTKSSVSKEVWDFMDHKMVTEIKHLSESEYLKYKSQQKRVKFKIKLRNVLRKIAYKTELIKLLKR